MPNEDASFSKQLKALINNVEADVKRDQAKDITASVVAKLVADKSITFGQLIAAFNVAPLKDHGHELLLYDFIEVKKPTGKSRGGRAVIDKAGLKAAISHVVNAKNNKKGFGKAAIFERLPSELQTETIKRNMSSYLAALAAERSITKGGGQKRSMLYLPGKKARA